MRYTKWVGLTALVGVMAVMATTISAEPTEEKIAARPISYADLGKLIRSHRGKVIVVDVWNLG